jgi:hypothetical protein
MAPAESDAEQRQAKISTSDVEATTDRVKDKSEDRKEFSSQSSKSKKIKPETIEVNRPKPPAQMRHDISDEQLQLLLDGSREGLGDVMNLASGLFVGLVVPSLEAVYKAFLASPRIPLNALNLAEFAGTFCSLGVAGGMLITSRKRGNRSMELAVYLRSLHNRASD